jgi:ABC-type phosphate transport system substrate-binding protein
MAKKTFGTGLTPARMTGRRSVFAATLGGFGLAMLAMLVCACGEQARGEPDLKPDKEAPVYINGASTVGNFIPEMIDAFRAQPGNENTQFIYPGSPGSAGLTCALDDKAPRGSSVWDAWQGSTWGMKLLWSRDVGIGAMSRRPSSAEIDAARAKGFNPKMHVLAYDAVALIAHPSHADKLRCLTRSQLRELYLVESGMRWSELGENRPDEKVRVLGSDPAICGTAAALAEMIDDGGAKGKKRDSIFQHGVEFCSLDDIVGVVAGDENAVGFCQFSLLKADAPVYVVPYLDDLDSHSTDPVTPTVESCGNGAYTLQRPLLLITNGPAKGVANRFIRFALGPHGKAILEKRKCIVPR